MIALLVVMNVEQGVQLLYRGINYKKESFKRENSLANEKLCWEESF